MSKLFLIRQVNAIHREILFDFVFGHAESSQ